jgi:hypothetical protein
VEGFGVKNTVTRLNQRIFACIGNGGRIKTAWLVQCPY